VPRDWYPENRSPLRSQLPEVDERFAAAREDYLLGFENFNTARAYWADLEAIYDWCQHRGFDIFHLTDRQFQEYQALLRRRRYSEGTIRRRVTAWRGFIKSTVNSSREPQEQRPPRQ